MFAAVRHQVPANTCKVTSILPLFDAYRAVLPRVVTTMVRDHVQGVLVLSWPGVKPAVFGTSLSGRHFKSVWNMAYAAVEAWRELLKDEVRKTVTGSTLPDDVKTVLYRLNRAGAWWDRGATLDWEQHPDGTLVVPPSRKDRVKGKGAPVVVTLPVDPEHTRLLRHVVKHARTRVAVPDLSRVRTLKLDSPVAPVHVRAGSRFRYWVRISTLTKGKPAWVPLVNNRYLRAWLDRPGAKLAGNVQLHQGDDGTITVSVVVQAPDVAPRTGDTWLGLDWGSNVLFATSDGRLLGRRMLHRLRELDALLVKHTGDLNRRGVAWKTDRYYQVLHARITGYVTNEVGRLLNQLAADQGLTGLVTEKLDFRHGGLSATMNRLVSRAGRGAVKRKLARLSETHGVQHTAVPAAYSSQECSRCGHTDRPNRKTRDLFACGCCGLTLHADINAGRTLLGRRSDQRTLGCNPQTVRGRTALLHILTTRHTTVCPRGGHPGHGVERTRPVTGRRDGTDRTNPGTAAPVMPSTM